MTEPRTLEAPKPDTLAAVWTAFTTATGTTGEPTSALALGDSFETSDSLVELVLDGTMRAMASSAAEHDALRRRPEEGDLSALALGDGTPVAVIWSTQVRVGPLTSVTESFARREGRDPPTLDRWIRSHRASLRASSWRSGQPVHYDIEVVYEEFEVVWTLL